MSVTTKKGDDGKSRWPGHVEDKDGPLLSAIGDLDELMAVVGIVACHVKGVGKITDAINRQLYNLSAYLAGYRQDMDLSEPIRLIEADIARMEAELPKLKAFLTPGEQLNDWFNWARVVARRAERSMVSLHKVAKLDSNILAFMNRLSDYLFMLGRTIK